MDCGHFMGRTHMSTRWLLDNLGVQCLTCNRVDNGRPDKFAEYIDRTYGKGHADWIRALAKQVAHFTIEDIDAITKKAKENTPQ